MLCNKCLCASAGHEINTNAKTAAASGRGPGLRTPEFGARSSELGLQRPRTLDAGPDFGAI